MTNLYPFAHFWSSAEVLGSPYSHFIKVDFPKPALPETQKMPPLDLSHLLSLIRDWTSLEGSICDLNTHPKVALWASAILARRSSIDLKERLLSISTSFETSEIADIEVCIAHLTSSRLPFVGSVELEC
jgi:hypothetical protein